MNENPRRDKERVWMGKLLALLEECVIKWPVSLIGFGEGKLDIVSFWLQDWVCFQSSP